MTPEQKELENAISDYGATKNRIEYLHNASNRIGSSGFGVSLNRENENLKCFGKKFGILKSKALV